MPTFYNTSLILLIVAVSFIFRAEGRNGNYVGYKVFRITPQNANHEYILKKLESEQVVLFWKGPSRIGKPSDVLLGPKQHGKGQLLDRLISSGFAVKEYISDVQRLIDAEVVAQLDNEEMNWESYYRLSDILLWVEKQGNYHSDIASTFVIGQSFEGRDLLAIKISRSEETKPAIFIDANIHAREWITSAVCTYLINELLNSDDPTIKSWTKDFDWYILPVLNPDGLEYSHTTNRMWRKTRSNSTINPNCKGTDGNRNYDFFWFTGGSSSNPCSDVYAGTSAFSEPETKAMSDFVNTIANRMSMYLSLHSYGQYMLIPFGHNNDRIPQYNTYMRIGKAAAKASAEKYGTVYTPGNVVDLLYVASGETFDWVKGIHNTNLTYIYELRDTGRYGFLLPPEQIIPTAEEFMDGLHVLINELRIGIPEVDPTL